MYPFDDDPPAPPGVPMPPMPSPAPQQSAWLQALPLLFALGAKTGGGQVAGTGALQGFQQGSLIEDQRRRQDAQLQMAAQDRAFRYEQQQAAQQALMEQRRQQAINTEVDNLRAAKFKTKADYDSAVQMSEALLGRGYGVRPNTLRRMVPFDAPDASVKAAEAFNGLVKTHGLEQALRGTVEFDRDGDGIPERVPAIELAKLGKVAVLTDPTTQQPMLPPKEVKPENLQQYDVTFQGVLAEYGAEGKDVKDPKVRGQASQEALRRNALASKEGLVAGTPQSAAGNELKEYQKFTAGEKLAGTWQKASQTSREMRRQLSLMQTGLQRFRQGDTNGGSQAVLVTFQKILDPTSVVRESEYARTSAGQSFLNRIEGYTDRLRKGGAGMTEGELSAMVGTATQMLQSVDQFTGGARSRITKTAKQYGIDPALVFDDAGMDLGGESGATPAPTSAAGGDLRNRAKQILQQGGYDASEASVDKFLANPKNKALLTGGR